MPNLTAFLSYVIVVSFTPGPNNILSMVNGSKYGYKKTLNFILGVTTGFFVLMMVCTYFNLILFNIMPKIKVFMSFLGAAYMLYLAYKIVFGGKKQKSSDDTPEEDKGVNTFGVGMTMQFVNPKAILYGITVVSNFIIPYYHHHILLIAFCLFFAFIAFASTTSWALFGSLFNRFLAKYERPFNYAMGLLLVYSAISISGITHLLH